jgi:hypothetical protein
MMTTVKAVRIRGDISIWTQVANSYYCAGFDSWVFEIIVKLPKGRRVPFQLSVYDQLLRAVTVLRDFQLWKCEPLLS